ncbi:MAG: Uma2 family endonuclease [Myxococcota bacterium]
MASVASPTPESAEPFDYDRIVLLRNATWADYQRLMEIRGDDACPRICYLEGDIELMSPSRSHEGIRSRIGRLVEAWSDVHGIEFSPYGSWTLEDKSKRGGVEPDECYVFHGREEAEVERPDLGIEVIWTSGRLDKRKIYEKLNVQELWFWKNETITVFVWHRDGYEERDASSVLPGIDVKQIAQHVKETVASRAVRAYREELRNPVP